jgi:hypothetical protein
MASDFTPLKILFNRHYNLACMKAGVKSDKAHHVGFCPPMGWITVKFSALRQKLGRKVFFTYVPDSPREEPTWEQEQMLKRLAEYLVERNKRFYFGAENGAFFVGVETAKEAVLLKLSV